MAAAWDGLLMATDSVVKNYVAVDAGRPMVKVKMNRKHDAQVIASQLRAYVEGLYPQRGSVDERKDLDTVIEKIKYTRDTLKLQEAKGMNEKKAIGLLQNAINDPVYRICPRLFFTIGITLTLVLEVYNSYNHMIEVVRTLLQLCRREEDRELLEIKMKLYGLLAKAYSWLGKYKVSVLYSKRALEISFLLNDTDIELKLYDKFGMYYYYLDDMQRSIYFHKRTIDSLLEPQISPIRELLITRYADRMHREELADSGNIRRKVIPTADYVTLKVPTYMEHKVYYSSSDSDDMPMSQSVNPFKDQSKMPSGPIRSPTLIKFNPKTILYSEDTNQDSRTAVYTDYELSNLRPTKLFSHMSTNRQKDFFFNGREIHAKVGKFFKPVGKQYYRRRSLIDDFVKLLSEIVEKLGDLRIKDEKPMTVRRFTVTTSDFRLSKSSKSYSPRIRSRINFSPRSNN